MSLRSFGILHVKTMFGNKGEGLLHACISSLVNISQNINADYGIVCVDDGCKGLGLINSEVEARVG